MSELATRRREIDTIENSIERRATLIVDMMEDQANRMVAAMDEPPPGMQEPDTATIRAMWAFSPYPNPVKAFWELHDLQLPLLLNQVASQPGMSGDERLKAIRSAHQQAELTALQRIYPQRAKLCMLGITTIERSVQLADHAAQLAARAPQQPQQEAMAY